jgi:hypothetical protein
MHFVKLSYLDISNGSRLEVVRCKAFQFCNCKVVMLVILLVVRQASCIHVPDPFRHTMLTVWTITKIVSLNASLNQFCKQCSPLDNQQSQDFRQSH